MSIIEVSNLTHSYHEKPLYNNAEFALYKNEHIGVTGRNGAGKSTLIKILTGEVAPDFGIVRVAPGARISCLDQYAAIDSDIRAFDYLRETYRELYELEQEMSRLYEKGGAENDVKLLERAAAMQEKLVGADFYAIDANIRRVASGLGLKETELAMKTEHLSGGMRAKLILAKLLLEEADAMLLDEPTNFLDAEHVEWLAVFLKAYKNAFLVVSHDHEFLDKISNGILDVEFGEIRKYHGGYTDFLRQKKHLREDYIRRYHSQQKEIERTEEYIRRNIAGVNTKMAQGRRTRLERMEKLAPPSFTEKPQIQIKMAEPLPHKAFEAAQLVIGYDYPLLPALGFTLNAGRKLAVTGFNGIGKSTLLKTLVGIIPALSGGFEFAKHAKIGYYEQDLKWPDEQRTPLQIMADSFPVRNPKELRRDLAQYGVKAEHVSLGIGTLSGGEQSRVKLCMMLKNPVNFLILDEPTNHLDAETKEALREALAAFPGCVIMASHEKSFYRDFADRVLDIESFR